MSPVGQLYAIHCVEKSPPPASAEPNASHRSTTHPRYTPHRRRLIHSRGSIISTHEKVRNSLENPDCDGGPNTWKWEHTGDTELTEGLRKYQRKLHYGNRLFPAAMSISLVQKLYKKSPFTEPGPHADQMGLASHLTDQKKYIISDNMQSYYPKAYPEDR